MQVPTVVVAGILGSGRSPRSVVLDLLGTPATAADGVIADLPGVLAERAYFEELTSRLPADQRESALASEPPRSTMLDPRRPARDLLEHLLDGICSCHLLYAEYARDSDDDSALTDDGDLVDTVDEDYEYDEKAEAEARLRTADAFADLVRDEAARTRDRLT